MGKIILYHGSSKKIELPKYGEGKEYNDYGRGFYCTEHLELAKEWACTELSDGYANRYELDLSGLKILNLSSENYMILHWLTLLLEHRIFQVSSPIMKNGISYLKEYFHIDLDQYDVIVGYRADDSYFSFAKAFINNTISLAQLSYAMKLGKLGEQYVLKSEEAFSSIYFMDAIPASSKKYYAKRKQRDDAAREAFFKELENESLEGLYMRDIIKEGVKADDIRLR